MNEERLRILKMVEEGKLSAEEGARLIEAMDAPAGGATGSRPRAAGSSSVLGGGRFVKIRVVDSLSGHEKINLNIPLGFAKLLSSLVPESQREQLEQHGINVSDLLHAVESGQTGTIAEIHDNDRGEHVEVTIE